MAFLERRAAPYALAAGVLLLAASAAASAAELPTVVLVVRHAEKASPTAKDPQLSAAGKARARALTRALGSAGVGFVYDTEFQRTQATVAPLAAKLGLTPVHWKADDVPGLIKEIQASRRGQIVLVCAHSNTVPAIVTGLAGTAVEEIPDEVFDNLYVVTLPADGPGRATLLKYGAPSPSRP
jgi:broad specificity phosphatase PhoE